MSRPRQARHAVLTVIGGALFSVALGLDDVAPDSVGLAVVVPVLLGFGVLEVYGQYADRYGSAGRAGVALTAVGLGFVLVAVLLYAVLPSGLLAAVLVGVSGATGAVSLALGSALLAVALRRVGLVGRPTAALVGLGVPAIPIAGAALAAAATPVGASVPAGVLPGLAGTPYGVGWMLVGRRLWPATSAPRAVEPPRSMDVSPPVVVSAVVGGALFLISVGRFVPLGPLSGTPWVNQSLALDVGHLVVGAAGVAVAIGRDRRLARTYARAAGPLALALVGLTVLGTFAEVEPFLGAARPLDLNAPDVFVHLSAGVVLVVIGFVVGEDWAAGG